MLMKSTRLHFLSVRDCLLFFALFIQSFFYLKSSPPSGSVNITGVAEVGQTLSASNDLNDADGGIATQISYEWLRGKTPISTNYIQNGRHGLGHFAGPTFLAVSHDGKHAYVTLENSDAIRVFDRNLTSGILTPSSFVKDGVNSVDGLEGASCVVLSSDGNFAYVTAKTDNSLSWFSRGTNGHLTYGGTIYNTDGGVNALYSAQRVILSPDENFAYVTSDGDNSVSWYSRNSITGALVYEGVVSGVLGAFGLTISTDGNYVYVTGSTDNAIYSYSRNSVTGSLTQISTIRDGDHYYSYTVDGLFNPRLSCRQMAITLM